jgi:hypothetical protein
LATGGGRRNKFVPQTIFSGLVGHNPKKSGKFISGPLIFSFPYAHAVDHSKLLQKLREFGFSGSVLLWFQNYSIRRLPAVNCSWSHITILAYYI